MAWIAVRASVFRAEEGPADQTGRQRAEQRGACWPWVRVRGWGGACRERSAGRLPRSPSEAHVYVFIYKKTKKEIYDKNTLCVFQTFSFLIAMKWCMYLIIHSVFPPDRILLWLLCTQSRSSQNVGLTGGTVSSCTWCWASQTQKFSFVTKSAQAQTRMSNKQHATLH